MTPAGIEAATFRFVAQHLNHCATAAHTHTHTHTHIYIDISPLINLGIRSRRGINTMPGRYGRLGEDKNRLNLPGFQPGTPKLVASSLYRLRPSFIPSKPLNYITLDILHTQPTQCGSMQCSIHVVLSVLGTNANIYPSTCGTAPRIVVFKHVTAAVYINPYRTNVENRVSS